jgi:secondary thiamine-phosphate synthase enzyme|tara:strand:- start:72 stop:494 length:423 start_codon:yes stop_codon:yes gene_type:complete
MIQKFLEIKIETNGQNLINISQEIEKFVENSGIKCGILNLSILHTSASLIIQENVSKDVLIDLENFFNKLVPMNENLYSHILEGKDDMPAHIKTALTNTNLTLSIIENNLKIGIWQGIYLFEHRIEKHVRSIFCHMIGEI